MNRVRMGLTGLALVFLIVLIGTANLWPFNGTEPKTQEETLATLGVAPGAEDDKNKAEELPELPATPPLVGVPSPADSMVIDDDQDLTEI